MRGLFLNQGSCQKGTLLRIDRQSGIFVAASLLNGHSLFKQNKLFQQGKGCLCQLLNDRGLRFPDQLCDSLMKMPVGLFFTGIPPTESTLEVRFYVPPCTGATENIIIRRNLLYFLFLPNSNTFVHPEDVAAAVLTIEENFGSEGNSGKTGCNSRFRTASGDYASLCLSVTPVEIGL